MGNAQGLSLGYSSDISGAARIQHIQKLQQLRNKAISIISNASRKTSVTPLYKKYGVLKLADLSMKWPK